MQKPKVGLALGSGAFRGLAHIGILDVFLAEGIPIDIVAGTSIGSLVGAVFAAGMLPPEMEEIVRGLKEHQYYDVVIPRKGLLAGKRVQTLVAELTENKTFEETVLPFAAVACDFEALDEVIIREGPLHEAVRASISIPGVFVPVEREGRVLVDGAFVNRVPASVCRGMGADIVIGVDVGYRGQRTQTENIVENVMHALDIFEWQMAKHHVSDADLMLAPDVMDFNPARIGDRGLECIERGRIAAREALPQIRALLEQARGENQPISV